MPPADNSPERAAAPEIRLRLIATSDLHACLLPYDYCANRPVSGRSLSDISCQIAQARAEVPNSLLFDNGDFLQGNPLADYVASANRRRRAHPVITAFNTLGYDAVTLGNHEFNYGLKFLTTALSQARFPVVSANIATRLGKSPSRDKTFVPPFAVLKRTVLDRDGRSHVLRIGVIGFAPPQIEVWDRDHLDGQIRMRDIIDAAKAWLPRLRARGADVIVALAHSGIGAAEAEDGMENAATALAALPEIDAVIAGHCHLAFPGPGIEARPGVDPVNGLLAGKPAVMPGHSGSHIGIIDLRLVRTLHGKRRWTVAAGEARLGTQAVAGLATARALRHVIASDHRAALAWSRQVLGESRVPLTTHFATSAPSAAIALVAEAKAEYARQALRGSEWADLPLLASAAPFKAGGRGGPSNFTDIPAGPVRMRNLSDIYVFPNTLVTLALTGADLADWLEQSAALFRQIMPGETDAILHDLSVPSFTFDVIPRLSYAIDLSQPARFSPDGRLANPNAHRIVGLRLDGQPLDPGQTLLLVSNNHRASRACAGVAGPAPRIVLSDGARIQTVVAEHIKSRRVVGCPPRRHWHFLPMPGTSVRIAAGSGSAAHLADIAPLRPTLLAEGGDGFSHYRLHL
ncbi:bifunctional 2',3'-cyclic-nucleotide 2'-phosphodiesterase/3'-nucleotidase [Tabrizicola sp.]|uniref:bifunctional 2',3'-cyclic-nucleotide 2'-phosphodiesterase/3'-nucleotidase n=1 Tax=Tabrizicola sp. TaxID=2005166 RepID=UPI00263613B3|nr:bifunctional 2',3'-cyclic-nucleotide 2'-phosphodiesterase/3'-nucleotidase [Tabrizicola sp.]MDM7933252.1 bifunctional 2',3'-cyclic-nucleotide 2'-phosphodiesterase/3'-nucleotidase [Tabrizicola sp.]